MTTLESPEHVVQAALQAADAGRLAELFDLLDPADLPRWRRVTLSMLQHFEQEPDAESLLAEWGVRNAAEAESLSDNALFERWMSAFSPAARARLAFGSTGATPPLPPVRRVVLGSVHEGAGLAHVVYREIVGNGSAMRIVTLRRGADGWKLGVDHDLLGLGSFHYGPRRSAQDAGATEG